MRVFLILLLSAVAAAAATVPGDTWRTALPGDAGLDEAKLLAARDYALTGDGSGYVVRGGKLVISWGDAKKLYDLKSSTKSFGAAALGLAIKDGKLRLEDKARQHHPTLGLPPTSNAETGWLDQITIFHLASQTAGFEKPGGYTRLLFKAGTEWDYSDSGPNWLAECITLAYRRDVSELMFERVFEPIGIQRTDLRWRKNQYRSAEIEGIPRREFGAGIIANVDAMARFGLLHLRGGEWNGKQILPREFISFASKPLANVTNLAVRNATEYTDASKHYGLLWWNNGDASIEGVPRDAYWSWGLHDGLIVVIPSLDIVVARAGISWKRQKGAAHYDVLKPFLQPIVAATELRSSRREEALNSFGNKEQVRPLASAATNHYPRSPVIGKIIWAPKEEIIRKAKGSDNWPMTWADDDALYTAYGDGNGFEPFLPQKLSLGLARIAGAPPQFTATNIRSTIEQKGDDKHGMKASGLLMVEGVLHVWLRNATNSQLAWSHDRGRTWTNANWRWTQSFGCPTFLNFGRNYSGARDDYVYVYSQDTDNAYTAADRMVLARVPKVRITERAAYEFFRSVDAQEMVVWTRNLTERGAVFSNPVRCYRSGISYNPALKRYLWCQLPGGDTRFGGGLAIYDAPEPWGPWTTVFYTQSWDVGPGESASFPTKWMSEDGRSAWLVFSGDDHFSARKATFMLSLPKE